MKNEDIAKVVREGYAKVAKRSQGGQDAGAGRAGESGSCCSVKQSCCGTVDGSQTISRQIGYSEDDISAVPEGANLGLGCGNPLAFASIREGDTVLDLGSGAGFDCFLASKRVGHAGRVIGVDMTPEMIDKARENARKGGFANVQFRLGEIEHLPVADNSVDLIISNCVINLSRDKSQVFREALRALRPGGKLMVSDIVLVKDLPFRVRDSVAAYVGCLSGAMKRDEYLGAIKTAGFDSVEVVEEAAFPIDLMQNDPTAKALVEDMGISEAEVRTLIEDVVSLRVAGVKADSDRA